MAHRPDRLIIAQKKDDVRTRASVRASYDAVVNAAGNHQRRGD